MSAALASGTLFESSRVVILDMVRRADSGDTFFDVDVFRCALFNNLYCGLSSANPARITLLSVVRGIAVFFSGGLSDAKKGKNFSCTTLPENQGKLFQ